MAKQVRIFIETVILPVLKRHLVKRKKQLLPPFQFKHIAVMKFGSLGDYALASHAIKALRLKFNDAKITFIYSSRKGVKIFEGSPYIDEFEHFDIFDKNGNFWPILSPKFIKELIVFYLRSWGRRFDVLVNLNRVESIFILLINMMIVYAAGAKIKIGLNTEGRGFFYDASIKDSFYETRPDSYTNLELVSLLGARDDRNLPSFAVSPEVEERVDELLRPFMQGEKNSIVCFHPGSYGKNRRWPATSFAELGNNLIKRFGDNILLVGTKGELELGNTIASLLVEKPINLIGKTTPLELSALIKKSCLFIGNDSGPVHIAVAQGIPAISIIGSGLKRYYSYKEKHFRYVRSNSACWFVENMKVCSNIDCSTRECMNNIIVRDVMAVVDEMQKAGIINPKREERIKI